MNSIADHNNDQLFNEIKIQKSHLIDRITFKKN